MRIRLGFQLLLSYVLAAVLIGFFIFTVLFEEIKPTIQNITKLILSDISLVLSKVIETEVHQEMRQTNVDSQQALRQIHMKSYYQQIFSQNELFQFEVLDKRGELVYSSDHHQTTETKPHLKHLNSITVQAPIFNQNEQIGVVELVKSNDSLLVIVDYLKHKVILYGLILIVALFLISGFFIYLINCSVLRLIEYSKALAEDKIVKKPQFMAPELTQLRLTLEEMKEKLDGKKYIENYIYTLTHELKSPLSSIIAATDILQDNLEHTNQETEETKMRHRYLTNIENQSIRMQQMIEKLLQLARLDNRSDVSFDLTNIATLIHKSVENTIDEAKVKQIHLYTLDIKPMTCYVDKFLLNQALINIISNALDFTPKNGEIVISTSIVNENYIIEIKDSGVGIPDFAINKVLDKFYSLPRPNKGKSSGLGLSFVQKIAKLHQGEFTIANRTDGQTGVIVCFSFKIMNLAQAAQANKP